MASSIPQSSALGDPDTAADPCCPPSGTKIPPGAVASKGHFHVFQRVEAGHCHENHANGSGDL